jgi:hypothetical protein
MAARQYHMQFPSEVEAKRFVHLAAWGLKDIAMHRSGCWVSVIDGHGNREHEILAMALRVSGERIED